MNHLAHQFLSIVLIQNDQCLLFYLIQPVQIHCGEKDSKGEPYANFLLFNSILYIITEKYPNIKNKI